MQPLAVSQPGTIWKCGNHLLLCGDATDSQAILALLDGETVSVALCDPPFGCRIDGFVSTRGRHREFVQASGEMDGDARLDFFSKNGRAACRERVCKYVEFWVVAVTLKKKKNNKTRY